MNPNPQPQAHLRHGPLRRIGARRLGGGDPFQPWLDAFGPPHVVGVIGNPFQQQAGVGLIAAGPRGTEGPAVAGAGDRIDEVNFQPGYCSSTGSGLRRQLSALKPRRQTSPGQPSLPAPPWPNQAQQTERTLNGYEETPPSAF